MGSGLRGRSSSKKLGSVVAIAPCGAIALAAKDKYRISAAQREHGEVASILSSEPFASGVVRTTCPKQGHHPYIHNRIKAKLTNAQPHPDPPPSSRTFQNSYRTTPLNHPWP